MRFDVLTIFPELFAPHLTHGVTRRAFESRQVDVQLWPLRDFAEDNYRRVDDRTYGGGPGMVMLAEPLEKALAAVKAQRSEADPVVIHFTPTIPHCTMATLIGLAIRVKLLRSLPTRFKVDIFITPETHTSEEAINKQLNDKERVAAALENSQLLDVVNQCLTVRD